MKNEYKLYYSDVLLGDLFWVNIYEIIIIFLKKLQNNTFYT